MIFTSGFIFFFREAGEVVMIWRGVVLSRGNIFVYLMGVFRVNPELIQGHYFNA